MTKIYFHTHILLFKTKSDMGLAQLIKTMASKKYPNLKFKNVISDSSSEDDEEDKGNDLLGLSLERLNLGPRKKLLVLGLGGLLVDRVHRYKNTNVQNYPCSDAIVGKFQVYRRPYCEEFLKFCFERFEVGIWSSAMERNIDSVLSTITRGLRGKLLFLWDQEECTDTGFKCLEKKDKPIFLKEMKKLWEQRRQFTSSNTLLIDDEPYKALLNPPNTAIFLETWNANIVKDSVLGQKSKLRMLLDGLADAKDVPCFVKEHPFGQPSITPSHPDWDFYSKIVCAMK